MTIANPFTLQQLRPTSFSRSAIINIATNYGRDFMDSYFLVKILASQYKHPIILDYKAQMTNIRLSIGITDKKFRVLMNNAINTGLAKFEGNNLRLLSNNQDRTFKTSKKNDYHCTSKPEVFKKMVLIAYHYQKQYASIRSDKVQTEVRLKASEQKATYNSKNYAISISCQAVSKLLQLNSTSQALKVILDLEKRNLIKVTKNIQQITKEEFKTLLATGSKNIGYDKTNKVWFKINASTFELKYNFKKVAYTKFDKLSEKLQNMYLSLGYTISQINSKLA